MLTSETSNLTASVGCKAAIELGAGAQREQKFELEAGGVVGQLDTGAVEPGDRGDQAEAEPVAGRAAAAFQPVEALEDLLTFVDRDSRPVIGNRNNGSTIVLRDLDNDLTGIAAVLDRIVDEIGHGIKQEVPVARHQHWLIRHHSETPALFLRGRIEQLRHLSGYAGEVYGPERRRPVVCLDLRDPHQRSEHAQDGVKVCHRIADQQLIMFAVARARIGLLEASAHARQRSAQIVRYVVSDLLHLRHQAFDAVKHLIEIFGEQIPLVS